MSEENRGLRQKEHMTPGAFFDLDGTLVPEPSLERRLMRFLYWRREWIPWKFALWLARYLKVSASPHEIRRDERWVLATHGNKMYWRNVRVASLSRFAEQGVEFFGDGVRQIEWHASRGDKIFLVSGTLEALAQIAANELRGILDRKGLPKVIEVSATPLAENDGRWTGELSGEAIWGIAKARAIERLGREHRIDLARSFAYANSASDCAMLAKVGNPVAINPSGRLHRIAARAGWPVVFWEEQKRRALELTVAVKTSKASVHAGVAKGSK